MKTCCRCGENKPIAEFHKVAKDRVSGRCKPCEASRVLVWATKNREKLRIRYMAWRHANPERAREFSRAQYRKNKPRFTANVMRRIASKIMATPPWAEHDKIAVVYRKAMELGMHVDHVVPLRHPKVCGLHVWHNLQLLAPEENLRKQNRHWPDMPGEGGL